MISANTDLFITGGVFLFFLGSIYTLNREITKRPTFKEMEERYTEKKVCDEIHKSVDEKLDCIPIIKDTVIRLETKMDILVKNGK